VSPLWLAAALALTAALGLVAAAAVAGSIGRRIVALQASSTVLACLVVALAAGQGEPAYLDLALAVVLLGFVGSLLVARFLERWL
jgi:multisubunit Na+/H+ antiporter MnhF subunit